MLNVLTSGKATHERQPLGSIRLLDLFSNCEGEHNTYTSPIAISDIDID
jgi:hypothetical protein